MSWPPHLLQGLCPSFEDPIIGPVMRVACTAPHDFRIHVAHPGKGLAMRLPA
jgi:hypothetical protein